MVINSLVCEPMHVIINDIMNMIDDQVFVVLYNRRHVMYTHIL